MFYPPDKANEQNFNNLWESGGLYCLDGLDEASMVDLYGHSWAGNHRRLEIKLMACKPNKTLSGPECIYDINNETEKAKRL